MQYTDLQSAVQVLTSVHSDVRTLFHQVEQLLRLLLVCPVSSCEAERSFSAELLARRALPARYQVLNTYISLTLI